MRGPRAIAPATAGAALLGVFLGWLPPCFAESEGEALFRQGVGAFQKGDYATACPLFQRSFDKGHASSSRYMHGQCEEKRGHLVAARDDYDWVVHDDKADEALHQHARESMVAVEKRIAKLVIDPGTPPVEGMTIEIDGTSVLAPSKPIFVDAGPHEVTTRAPGHEPRSEKVTAGEGGTITVIAKAGPVLATPERPEKPPAPEAHSLRVPGWVLIGVGAAGLVGAGVTGGVILSQCGGLSKCPSQVPDGGGPREKTPAQVNLEIANGLLWGVGGAAAALGVTFVLVDAASAGKTTKVGVQLHPGGVRLAGRF